MTRVFDAALEFFRAPAAEKEASQLPEDCGYRPTGVEYSRTRERPDRIESFTAGYRSIEFARGLSTKRASVLHARMIEVIGVLASVAETITVKASRALTGVDHSELHGGFANWSRLQVNYSRPVDVAEGFINEFHEDGNLLTVACANSPGLEIKLPTGEFVPMTALPPQILVMPGEIAWLLSGGAIAPLYHHVRSVPGVLERTSLLLFYDVDPDLCQPWICNDVNAGVDIGARVIASDKRFGLKGWCSV